MDAMGAAMAKPKLGEIFPLRLSKGQRATLDENAEAAGLTRSEFLRREAGLPNWGKRDRSAVGQQRTPAGQRPSGTALCGRVAKGSVGAGPGDVGVPGTDLELRIAELMKTMPRVNAERLARRELARVKAKAALGDSE